MKRRIKLKDLILYLKVRGYHIIDIKRNQLIVYDDILNRRIVLFYEKVNK